MEQERKTILEVHDLNVYYTDASNGLFKKGKRRQILHGLNFSMKEGEILGLVGESGCGKSTLAKAIIGMQTDYEGDVIHGSKLGQEELHPQMVFQDPYGSLNPAKTIGFIMEEPLKNCTDLSKEERVARVENMLEKVGLKKEWISRYPHQLSGGQRQRVCIGAALMLEPKLLIADEPVSALDVTIQAQIVQLLLELHKEMNLSILFISHDLRVVYQMCEKVMIMKAGKIIESGDTEEVYFNPKEEYTKNLLKAAGILQI